MKNTKSLILLLTLATATLISSTSLAVSPQTAKNLCKWAGLLTSFNIIANGLLGSNLFGKMATTYKKDGIFPVFSTFFLSAFIEMTPSSIQGKARKLHIPTIIVGAWGIAISYAGMGYFDNQIKAQQQLINLNSKKKEKEHAH